MIISHRHKFIFVHLGRTAGRSVTQALIPLCGPEDVITKTEGFAQNADGYKRHMSAMEIRDRLGRDRFEAYFKFTIERNPWEKMLSRYRDYLNNPNKRSRKRYYKEIPRYVTGRPLNFQMWFELKLLQSRLLSLGHARFPKHYDSYVENGRMIVDLIARQESLSEHMKAIGDRLSLNIPELPRVGYHATARDMRYTEYFTPRMRRVVERIYERDLGLLGYRFGEPFPSDMILREEHERRADAPLSRSGTAVT